MQHVLRECTVCKLTRTKKSTQKSYGVVISNLLTFYNSSFVSFLGPPKIESKSVERYIKTFVGNTVRLRCPVVANPPALTMWKKDGESINSIWERFKVKESGLRIEDVVQDDSGIYVCIATNGFGTAKLNITLSVVGK